MACGSWFWFLGRGIWGWYWFGFSGWAFVAQAFMACGPLFCGLFFVVWFAARTSDPCGLRFLNLFCILVLQFVFLALDLGPQRSWRAKPKSRRPQGPALREPPFHVVRFRCILSSLKTMARQGKTHEQGLLF
jgi:hypothetical protein